MAAILPPLLIDDRTNALAQNACNGLPPEISNLIAGYFEWQHILKTARLSRELHSQAIRIIYHDIALNFALDFTGPADQFEPNAAVLLLRTLVSNKNAASMIRRLAICGDPLLKWRAECFRNYVEPERYLRGRVPPDLTKDLSCFTHAELQMYKSKVWSDEKSTALVQGQVSLPKLCMALIELAIHLRHLRISSDHLRYPYFRCALRNLVDAGGLRELETSDLCSDLCSDLPEGWLRSVHAVQDFDAAMLVPFLTPGTKSVAAVMALQASAVSELRLTSINRLVLRHCQIDDFDLNGLLAATFQLRYLEYHAWVDYRWYTSPRGPQHGHRVSGLESLFEALKHVSNTLEHLVTSQRYVVDSPHRGGVQPMFDEPPFTQRRELSRLSKLQTLTIPYASLLGWQCKKDQHRDWDQLLPSSLSQIIWTDHLSEHFSGRTHATAAYWNDKNLMPVILTMIAWLAKLPRSARDAKFGLLLVRAKAEFHEPVRKAILQMCEDHGINCTIDKREPDMVFRPSFPGGRHGTVEVIRSAPIRCSHTMSPETRYSSETPRHSSTTESSYLIT